MADNNAPPATFLHSISFYNAMMSEATEEPINDGEEPAILYSGLTTRLIINNTMNSQNYSKARAALLGMGCIRQLKRGGGRGGVSIYELRHAPTLELYDQYSNGEASAHRKRQTQGELAHQQTLDLLERVNKLEHLVNKILGLEE